MDRNHKKGQSLSEYVLLLALVTSVFIGMQLYVRRGLQGRLRDASDYAVQAMNRKLGSAYAKQYEPYYRTSSKDVNQGSSFLGQMFEGGGTRKDYLGDTTDVTSREVIR